jgi:hypothetical protein
MKKKVYFEAGSLYESRLARNLKSSHLSLLSIGIIGVSHYVWLRGTKLFLKGSLTYFSSRQKEFQ